MPEQRGWLRFNPNTALSMGLAVAFIGLGPGMNAIFFDVPFPPGELREVALVSYVGLLFFAYLAAVLVATDIDLPWPWAARWERRLERLASLPYTIAGGGTPGLRRVGGALLLASGVAWLALGEMRGGASGPTWGALCLMASVWLVLGRFEGEHDDRWVRLTRKAGMVLGFLAASSLVGEFLWWLIQQPWNPLTWRLYSLWAVLQFLIAALGIAVMADTIGRTLEQRLGLGVIAVVCLVLTSLWPVRMGESESRAREPGTATSVWFDAVEARLAEIPGNEPVIFVAASGGGSRAALHATAVLEALERTPPHGPVGSWDEIDGDSLADRVLFISSVSGGSLASAHYAFGAEPPDPPVARPKNTPDEELRAEAKAEWTRLCEQQKEHSCRGPCVACDANDAACFEQECVERRCLVYARLCTAHSEGYQRELLDDANEFVWPIHSVRIDAMATGFNAPLMRGMVGPGLERGESMSRFWRQLFGWSERAAGAVPGSRPLLLIDLTDVDSGTRLVAGFPQLPPGLLSSSRETGAGSARGLLDLQEGLSVEVEEAVRMSANFPWGFDLPVLVRDPQVLAIDGGVLDNTGIDTLVTLLRRLEQLADPSAKSVAPRELREKAASLIRELGRRGVVLLEIDSGAKPEAPGVVARILYSLLMPVHALSMSSYVRSVEASGAQVRLMQSTLRRIALRSIAEECGAKAHDHYLMPGVVQGERLTHVVYVLDTESLDTSWALGPSQKGKLLARFLAEDAGQRLELRDEFLDLWGANSSRCAVLERARDPGFRSLVRGLQQLDEELQRHENEEKVVRGEHRRLLYDDPDAAPATRSAPDDHSGWIYIGQYRRNADPKGGPDADPSWWLTTNLSLPDRRRPPGDLVGHTLETSDSLYLLREMPAEAGRLQLRSPPFRLPSYVFVEIQAVEEWNDSGFWFAEVKAPDGG